MKLKNVHHLIEENANLGIHFEKIELERRSEQEVCLKCSPLNVQIQLAFVSINKRNL